MAETGRLRAARPLARWAHPVTLVRIAIILAVLVIWEAVAASGLLYRDVVPRLGVIAAAMWKLLSTPDYYWHLWVTGYEIAIGLALGGITGLVVGLALGANRLLSKAY